MKLTLFGTISESTIGAVTPKGGGVTRDGFKRSRLGGLPPNMGFGGMPHQEKFLRGQKSPKKREIYSA